MSFKQVTQANFTKGLNTATGKATPVPNSLLRISNLLYTKRGSLVTPDGVKLYSANTNWNSQLPLTPTGSWEIPVGMFAAVRGPNLFPLAITLNSSGGIIAYDMTTNPATQITLSGDSFWVGGTFFSPGHIPAKKFRIPQLVNVNQLTVLLPGNDSFGVPFANFYTGVKGQVGTQVPTVTAAAHGCYHQGFLWLWNTGPTQGQIDGPSTLRMCAQDSSGNPDLSNFPVTSVDKVDANDGTQGRGLISFTSSEAGIAPTATLVLFKDFATYQVTGLLAPNQGFAVTRAQTDMGCVASRTIQFAPGFGVVRLTHFGVAVFDGSKDTLISEEIRPYFFPEESDIFPIDWERVEIEATAAFTFNPPMYVMSVPVVGHAQGCQRLLCYDLVLKAWTVVDVPYQGGSEGNIFFVPILTSLSLIASMKIPGIQPFTLLATSSEPYGTGTNTANLGAFRWQGGDGSWPMGWSVKFPNTFGQTPDQPLYVRRSVLRMKTPAATITAKADFGGSGILMSDTFPFIPLSNQSIYGTSKYGFAVYSGGDQDMLGFFDFGARAFSAAVTYSGPPGTAEIMSNSWHFVQKPQGTPARIS